MLFTIQNSQELLQPGNYVAFFSGLTTIETQKGKALRWEFKTEQGRTISGLSDAESPPTVRNKTGRWLAALATKPLTAGTQVEPTEYEGKKYMLIISPHENGGRLETFSLLA